MWLFVTPYLGSRDTAHAQYEFWPKHDRNDAFGISKRLIFDRLLNFGKL